MVSRRKIRDNNESTANKIRAILEEHKLDFKISAQKLEFTGDARDFGLERDLLIVLCNQQGIYLAEEHITQTITPKEGGAHTWIEEQIILPEFRTDLTPKNERNRVLELKTYLHRKLTSPTAKKVFAISAIGAMLIPVIGPIMGIPTLLGLRKRDDQPEIQLDTIIQNNATIDAPTIESSTETVPVIQNSEPANLSKTHSRSSEKYPPLVEETDKLRAVTNGLVEKDPDEDIYLVPIVNGGVLALEIKNGEIDELRSHDAEDTQTLERLADGSVVVSEETEDGWNLTKLEPNEDSFTAKTSIKVDKIIDEIICLGDLIYTRSNTFGENASLRDPNTLEVVETTDMFLVEDTSGSLINLSFEYSNFKYRHISGINLEIVDSNLDVIASTTEIIGSPYSDGLSISTATAEDKIYISIESARMNYQKHTTLILQKDSDQITQVRELEYSGIGTFLDKDTLLVQKLMEKDDGQVVVTKKVLDLKPIEPYVMKEQESPNLELIIHVDATNEFGLGMSSEHIKTYIMPQAQEFDLQEITITKDQPIEVNQQGINTIFKQSFDKKTQGTETIFHSLISGIVPTDALEATLIMEEQNSGQRFLYDITPDSNGRFTTETEAEQINFGVLNNLGVDGFGELIDAFGNNYNMKLKIGVTDANGYYLEIDTGAHAEPVSTDVIGSYCIHFKGDENPWDVRADGEIYHAPGVVWTFSDITMARIKVNKDGTWMGASLNEKGTRTGEFYGYADQGYIYLKSDGENYENDEEPQYGLFRGATLLAIIGGASLSLNHARKKRKAKAYMSQEETTLDEELDVDYQNPDNEKGEEFWDTLEDQEEYYDTPEENAPPYNQTIEDPELEPLPTDTIIVAEPDIPTVEILDAIPVEN
jgi:hypothetical protein